MIHFVVQDENDSAGVVVVEGVKAGQELSGWVMDQDKTIKMKVQNDIPIGHKFALKNLAQGATVIKYGHDIGKTVAPIKTGEHLHAQRQDEKVVADENTVISGLPQGKWPRRSAQSRDYFAGGRFIQCRLRGGGAQYQRYDGDPAPLWPVAIWRRPGAAFPHYYRHRRQS